jgi:hypothetical protein
MAVQAALLEEVADKAKDFDLIHAHIDWLHLPLLSRLGVPFLTTCHGRLDLPLFPDVSAGFRMRLLYRSRKISVYRCRKPIGWARFIMACPQTYFGLRLNPARTSPSLEG